MSVALVKIAVQFFAKELVMGWNNISYHYSLVDTEKVVVNSICFKKSARKNRSVIKLPLNLEVNFHKTFIYDG
jgi:hypothetical protein